MTDTPSYYPDSSLAVLVRRARPLMPINAADATAAHITLIMGVAVIGKLMSITEAVRELSSMDLASLGQLLTELAATAHELAEIERDGKEVEHV